MLLATKVMVCVYHMQRYTFGFVFLVAATSSNENRRHFLPPQSINSEKRSAGCRKCVDFTVIAGKSVLELTSLASFSKNRFSLGLNQNGAFFGGIFHNSKNRKKSRIQPNSKFFSKKYFTKHAYLITIKNILGARCTLTLFISFVTAVKSYHRPSISKKLT